MMNELLKRVNNIKDEKKKKVIASILKNKNWYKELSMDTSLSILIDLGYKIDEAKKIYISLNTNN